MARGRTLVAVLASLALGTCAEPREDDVTLVQQGVLRVVGVTEDGDGAFDDIEEGDIAEGSDASVVGQGVAAFAGVQQALAFEMTMGQLYAEHALAGGEAEEPSPGRCTLDELSRANQTVVRLATQMLSDSHGRDTAVFSAPSVCPKDPTAIAAALAFNSGNFGQCMQQLLSVSEPCSECMTTFVSSARGCISQCIPMITGCGKPAAWSDNTDKAECPDKSSACLACNVPHLKAMTECSGAFALHRQEYYKFLDGAVGLVKDGSLMDPEKLKDYMVQFTKRTQGS